MTVQSLTLSEKSVRKILEARDSRQDSLAQVLSEAYPATLVASLNIPGYEKNLPGTQELFASMMQSLARVFGELSVPASRTDALGPFAIISLQLDPLVVKKRCVQLESLTLSARLVDLDVYSAEGCQIDRQCLAISRRTCLVCDQAAVECIRLKRHSFDVVIGKVHELLAQHRA